MIHVKKAIRKVPGRVAANRFLMYKMIGYLGLSLYPAEKIAAKNVRDTKRIIATFIMLSSLFWSL